MRSELSKIATYVSEKRNTKDIDLEEYISTENMLPDKGGITLASSLPSVPKTNSFEMGDVLFSNIRTYFKKIWFAKFSGGVSTDVLVIRSKNLEVLHDKYLYYIISDEAFIQYTVTSAKGTKMPRGDKSAIMNYEVKLPPLPTQKMIAYILSTLDDKIELNRKMNQTLEEMAQALFKSWFVDFDPVHAKAGCSSDEEVEAVAKELGISKEVLELFPSEFVESELGMIPKGWEVETISNHIKVVKGKSYKSSELQESRTSLVTLKSFLRGGGYRTDGLKPYTGTYKPEQVVKPGEMVIAYTDVTQAADVIGKPAIVLDDEEVDVFVASLDVGIVRTITDKVNKMFLYQLFKTPSFQGYILGHTSGTTVLHLSKSWLDSFDMLIPTYQLMQVFGNITQPLFDKFNENIKQIRTLQKTRDSLLPKLLSGELDVSDINSERL
ncbi:MAG: restriction endonuclease subunit S [Sulfurovum sp.]|nr:restriction endonuclease subunit S [Sulfurovum sp.]